MFECEKEISHRQELARVLFSCSISNQSKIVLVSRFTDWNLILLLEAGTPTLWVDYDPPAPDLLFAGWSRGLLLLADRQHCTFHRSEALNFHKKCSVCLPTLLPSAQRWPWLMQRLPPKHPTHLRQHGLTVFSMSE